MTETVPPQYATELRNRWTAYQGALRIGTASLVATTLMVLNLTIDKCSVALGRPKQPRPSGVDIDGVLMLEYPA